MQYVNIADIKPAIYNPRTISKEKTKQLEKSIKENGFCIPVLVNKGNNTIIAGHQRTKAARAIGLKAVPCFYIDNITESDEVLFNQIHNGCDNEADAKAIFTNGFPDGFSQADNSLFEIENYNAPIVKEICHLLLRYGNVLMCVIHKDEMIIGKNYAYACKLLNFPVNISVIASDGSLLRDKYGEYSYDHLTRSTWVQGLAQMHRLPEGNRRQNKSSLYENFVLPYIAETRRAVSVLDFGCGKGEYISRVVAENAIGIEFYNQNMKSINVAKGNKQIDALIDYLKNGKLFDVVICDSVMNSVDSVQAETSVIVSLNSLCKNGGKLFISGRRLDDIFRRGGAKQRQRRRCEIFVVLR